MWKLRGRDNKIRQWADLGEFPNIVDAAKRILELEGDPTGALFFQTYVDPNPLTAVTGTADAEILSRLEYQSRKGFYLLERTIQ